MSMKGTSYWYMAGDATSNDEEREQLAQALALQEQEEWEKWEDSYDRAYVDGIDEQILESWQDNE